MYAKNIPVFNNCIMRHILLHITLNVYAILYADIFIIPPLKLHLYKSLFIVFLLIISKERGQVSNTFLHDLFSIQTFDQILHELSSKYVENAFKRKNPLIGDLLNHPFFNSNLERSPFNLIGFNDQIT